MLSRLLKRREDEGFTLIELLVVIIIIGILAAIAIPVFLNQRKNAWDAAVESDLRNAATAQETVLTDAGVYTADVADLQAAGFKYSDGANYCGGTAEVEAVPVNGESYTIVGQSASGKTFTYSSEDGLTSADGDC